jgi:hypothetical protein
VCATKLRTSFEFGSQIPYLCKYSAGMKFRAKRYYNCPMLCCVYLSTVICSEKFDEILLVDVVRFVSSTKLFMDVNCKEVSQSSLRPSTS